MANLPSSAMLNQIRPASGIPPRVTISGSWYKAGGRASRPVLPHARPRHRIPDGPLGPVAGPFPLSEIRRRAGARRRRRLEFFAPAAAAALDARADDAVHARGAALGPDRGAGGGAAADGDGDRR